MRRRRRKRVDPLRPRCARPPLPKGEARTACQGQGGVCIVGTTGAEAEPFSKTVGNGLCAVPGALRIEPVWINGTTPDMSFRANECESRNPPKQRALSCVGYFCYLRRFLDSACAAVGMTEGTTFPHMSFRAKGSESRNLLKLQALPCVGSFSHVVDSSAPLRCGRNDKMGGRFWYYRKQFRPFGRGTAHRPFPTVSLKGFPSAPTVPTMRNAVPHSLISLALWRASFPRGKLLYRALRWPV